MQAHASQISLRVAFFGIAAFFVAACDPAGALNVENRSDAQYVARTIGYDHVVRFYAVPPRSLVMVAENAVGSRLPPVQAVDLMDASCKVAYSKVLKDEPFPGGGVLTIAADGAITFAGGLADIVEPAAPSQVCGPGVQTPEPLDNPN